MKRHATSLRERPGRDSTRVTGFDQWTDGEAQLVHAIRVEQRLKQRWAAFAQHLRQTALRELREHDAHIESLLATDDDIGDTGKRFFLRAR